MALSLELTDTCRFFLKRFPVCFNLLALLFLVIPCILVAGVIPSKKNLMPYIVMLNIAWENFISFQLSVSHSKFLFYKTLYCDYFYI